MNFKLTAIVLLFLGATEAIRVTTVSDTDVAADLSAFDESASEEVPEAKSFVGLDFKFKHKRLHSRVAKAGAKPHFAYSL